MYLKVKFRLWFTILTAIIAVCLLLGFAVPQWHVYYPSSSTFGLHRTCQGNDCQGWNYPQQIVSGGGSCTRNGNEWKDRNAAAAAFLWIDFILMIVLAVVLSLSIIFDLFHLDGAVKVIIFTVCAACGGLLMLISIAIFGGTHDSWIGCGDNDFCDIANPPGADCGYGLSFILACCAMFIFFIAAGLIFLKFFQFAFRHRRVIEFLIMCAMIIGIAFTLVAGASSRWIVISRPMTSIGLFQNCVGADCDANTYDQQARVSNSPTCDSSGPNLQARLNAVAAFTFMPFLVALALFVYYLLRLIGVLKMEVTWWMKVILMVLVGVILLFLFIALVVYGATMNSWLFCGESFCSVQSNAGASCTYGFAFAVVLIALILAIFVLLLQVLDFFQCCNCGGRLEYDNGGEYYYENSMSRSNKTTHYHRVERNSYSGNNNNTDSSSTSYQRTTTTRTETRTTTYTTSSGRPLPSGTDWEWDEASSYYWSNRRQLYWDEPSDQFYDPVKGTWFDARTR